LLAGIIGTVVEWYDYAVYGFVATIIAAKFFASGSDVANLLNTFAAFGLGFVARPLGGILFGRLGDARGRKPALVLTLFLMAVSTCVIGLIPTYDRIGVWAPLLLVICRLVQGFSAGGEWGGSTTFIVEWSPASRRGYFGSFQQASVAAGLLLGSGVCALVATILPVEQMEAWGWRIPFLLGALLLPIGIYIRSNVDDTPRYREFKARTPARSAMPWKAGVQTFLITILWTVSFYLILSYMPTFTQKYAGLSRTQALWSNTIGLLVVVMAIPIMGRWSDRAGRRPFLLACGLGFLFLTYPLFTLMLGAQSLGVVLIVQIVFGIMLAAFSGPGPAAVAELFPTGSRSMWMSTAYSLAVAIFGGFAPYIATSLINLTHSPVAPTFYIIAAAIISTLAMMTMRETADQALS
jgi:MHS family proline/betaine transporter-like MFS transporter